MHGTAPIKRVMKEQRNILYRAPVRPSSHEPEPNGAHKERWPDSELSLHTNCKSSFARAQPAEGGIRLRKAEVSSLVPTAKGMRHLTPKRNKIKVWKDLETYS